MEVMFSESEIRNLKKILRDEMRCNGKEEELFDEMIEKIEHLKLDEEQKICEALEIRPEFAAYMKDKFRFVPPGLTLEEVFRKGIHHGIEFCRIEQKQHKGTNGTTVGRV